MKHTEQRLAEVFRNTGRNTGLISRLGSHISNIRRHANTSRTIRHWSPAEGFVPMTLGG